MEPKDTIAVGDALVFVVCVIIFIIFFILEVTCRII